MRRTFALLISAVLFVSMLVLGVVSKMQAQNTQGQQCSLNTLQGSYGILATGFFQGTPPNIAPTAPAASNPFAQIGTVSFDGAGHALGVFTFSFNGVISSIPPQMATYTVAPDCTGTITVSPPATGAGSFVIVAKGNEFLFIQTVAGSVVSAIAIKQ